MTQESRFEIRLELVRGHWALGEHGEALRNLEACAAETSRDPGRLRAVASELLAGAGPALEGELRAALERLAGAAPAPVPRLATATMAELLEGQGHLEEALRVTDAVLERDPADVRARELRARLSGRGSGRASAIQALERWRRNARRRMEEVRG